MNRHDEEHVTQAAKAFFLQANIFQETIFERFVIYSGMEEKVVLRVFRRSQWLSIRDDWLLIRARKLMDELSPSVVTRQHFSRNRLSKMLGINRSTFERVVGLEWKDRAAKLPTGRDIVLAKVDEMVASNVPLSELTVQNVCRAAGIMARFGPWLGDRLRLARRELAKRENGQIIEPPACVNARVFPGGWIDLDSDQWDLKVGRAPMRRNQLRPDVADIAWPLLREELRAEELSLNTVWNHFRNFLYACELLQGDVPDVRTAMIGPMQSAWCGYDGTPPQKEGVRFALIQLFSALFMLAERDPSINRKEMLNIIVWLRTKVRLPAQTVDKNFLTEGELDHLIYCSLLDIKDGIEFSKIHPNLQTMTTRRDRAINAAPVVNWSVALMTLLMAFTGLRHSSVTGMNVNDWMELNEHFSSIIWHHKKKREEDLVFTPVMLIRLLECYVRATDKIREALGTKRVFLTGTNIGDWIACPDQHTLNHYLQDFVQRHRLVRGEVPIALSSVILRRTYATHQLYKGRSLWFIRTQFGHTSISHTKDYVQFDRYEHPAQVGKALDEYGRRVLNLWHKPVVPENLAPDQRATVFNDWRDYPKDKVSNQIDNDASIISALVPCSTCDSLMTGKEFFEGWYKERIEREERLQRLDTDSEAVDVYEKEQSEFQHFMKNYILVKEDYEKWAG